jgi:hypothetical protein
MRRVLLSLVSALALTLTVSAGPARAATVVSYVTSAYNTPGSQNTLSVFLTGDTDLKTISAHLTPTRNPAGQAIDVTNFTWSRSGQQITAVSGVINPPALDLYSVRISATDTLGNTLRVVQNPGAAYQFSWLIQPTITVSASTADADHRLVTVTGQVTGAAPTGANVVMSNRKVEITIGYADPTVQHTDANGQFTVQFTPGTSSTTVWVAVNRNAIDEADLGFAGNSVDVVVATEFTRVSATADRITANSSDQVTVSGLAERQVNGAWVPFAGQKVYVGGHWWNGSGPNPGEIPTGATVVTTDATGHYSAPVPVQETGPIMSVVTPNDLWYTMSSGLTATVTVAHSVALSFQNFQFDVWGRLSVTGYAQRTGIAYLQNQVQLEYSPNGRDHWQFVKRVPASSGFFEFLTFYWGRSGYWRLHYLRDSYYKDSVSVVRRAWRWNAHFVGFHLSPRSASYKGHVTISGHLVRWYPKGNGGQYGGYGNVNVRIFFNCHGGNTWYGDDGWTRTDSRGYFSKRVTAYCTGTFVVVFYGRPGIFAAESNPAPVTVSGSPLRTIQAAPLTPSQLPQSAQIATREPATLG